MNRRHDLKINFHAYEDVLCRRKTFEIRLNDRGFQRGDCVQMRCWDKGAYDTSKPPILATISYVTNFQQKEGWCVFGLKDVKEMENE